MIVSCAARSAGGWRTVGAAGRKSATLQPSGEARKARRAAARRRQRTCCALRCSVRSSSSPARSSHATLRGAAEVERTPRVGGTAALGRSAAAPSGDTQAVAASQAPGRAQRSGVGRGRVRGPFDVARRAPRRLLARCAPDDGAVLVQRVAQLHPRLAGRRRRRARAEATPAPRRAHAAGRLLRLRGAIGRPRLCHARARGAAPRRARRQERAPGCDSCWSQLVGRRTTRDSWARSRRREPRSCARDEVLQQRVAAAHAPIRRRLCAGARLRVLRVERAPLRRLPRVARPGTRCWALARWREPVARSRCEAVGQRHCACRRASPCTAALAAAQAVQAVPGCPSFPPFPWASSAAASGALSASAARC